VIIPIPYVLVGLGLALAAVSVPLILRRVPMNRWYGVRTRKAFASSENWYELNEYGGKLLLCLGGGLVVFGLIGFWVAPAPDSVWAAVYLVVPLLGLVPVIALIRARDQRLP
jgi:hypothetical protein